ncbi:MAG TPA: lysozyme [Acidobacteriaceae bacterium]|nr:lysozyme [Acidobacteriaceae bacterium]
MNDYEYSSAGLALTRSFEGLRLTAYQDSAGVWTIGFGHTGSEVRAGQHINEAEAEALLRADLDASVKCVRQAVKVPLTQHQFDALADFCFNAGRGSFLGSTLLHDVNRCNFASAAAQFGLWVHAGGRVIPGLVRRRAAEAALFSGQGNCTPSTEVAVAEPGSALAPNGGVTIA